MSTELNAESLKKIKSILARLESGGHADYFELVAQLDEFEDAVRTFTSETEQQAYNDQRA